MSSQGMTTHFCYTCEHYAEWTGSWFLPAALLTHSLVTRPGTWRAWALDSTFISQHQMKTVLLLWVWWSAAAAWCFREGEWYQRHGHVELFRSEELQVRSARFVPWGLPHTDLADEPCGTLTSCSLLYRVFLSPGSTKVLTSPTESQLTCLLCSPPLFIFFSSMCLSTLVFPRELLSLHMDSQLGSRGIPLLLLCKEIQTAKPLWSQSGSNALTSKGFPKARHQKCRETWEGLEEGYLPSERSGSASIGLIRAKLNLITHLLPDLQDTPALHSPEWWMDDSI